MSPPLSRAPQPRHRRRIRSRTSHAFGLDPAEMARILDDQRTVEPLLRRSCTHEIVATLPVAPVVEQILAIAGAAAA